MKNAAVVLETVKVLQARGWRVTEEHIRRGLANTRWPARFEVLQKDPVFIVDGGHNPHGIRATAQSLERLFPGRKFTFVTGVMADKDVESILGLIVPLADQFFTVRPDNPRAMSADELARRHLRHGREGHGLRQRGPRRPAGHPGGGPRRRRRGPGLPLHERGGAGVLRPRLSSA